MDNKDTKDPIIEQEVEDIIGHQFIKKKGKLVSEYLVKQKGYPTYENSWEPKANLANAKELLDEYKVAAIELAKYKAPSRSKK